MHTCRPSRPSFLMGLDDSCSGSRKRHGASVEQSPVCSTKAEVRGALGKLATTFFSYFASSLLLSALWNEFQSTKP